MMNMRPLFWVILFLLPIITVNAQSHKQKNEGYIFTEDFRIPCTPVENQYRSGTCWSFSGLALLEAEMLRLKKDAVDLSEMFVVDLCYKFKADRYVRMHGNLNFGGGGAFHDNIFVWKNYGLVPESEYPGLNYGSDKHIHGEMDQALLKFVKNVVETGTSVLSPTWKNDFAGIIDTYLGTIPNEFSYKGKTYTPKSFASEYIGLNPDNYIELTSFTHHPFYQTFILEIPDNWYWGSFYNLPLDEFTQVIDSSLIKGYTVAWAADVSHKGFCYEKGIAVIPETDVETMDETEKAKWGNVSESDMEEQIYQLNTVVKEKTITQEYRQTAFDNYTTTDDHGMLLVGIAHDQKGNEYYIVKNSWGPDGKYKGYFYASKAFVIMQATNIMVNKEAIPETIRKKLGI
jgi:bleomycin hydrolase